jgi:hypothetical protein
MKGRVHRHEVIKNFNKIIQFFERTLALSPQHFAKAQENMSKGAALYNVIPQ